MASRIINSPGVQINEIDETAIQSNVFGTDVLITGFASKGPTDEIISISSISEFEQIFGTPTNAAERYFYYSVRPMIGTGANLLLSRLPYGSGNGDGFGSQYSAVVYPVVAVSGNPININTSNINLTPYTATATAGIPTATGTLTSVAITLSGLYYTTAPLVTVSAPTSGTSGVTATLSANITLAGGVSSLAITNAGTGYITAPTITIATPTLSVVANGLGVSGIGGLTPTLSAADAYVLGKPVHFTLTKAQYLSCINGEAFAWSNTTTSAGVAQNIASISDFGKAGMVIFNKAQTTINDKYEGYYIGVIDNTNANPATPFDGIVSATTVNTAVLNTGNKDATTPVPATRLNFALSGSNASNGTLSQAYENAASFNIGTNQFNDYLTLGVVKLRQSIFSPDTIKLDYIVEEKFVASLDFYRQRTPENGGPITSAYIGSEVNDSSRNITIMVNDFVSNRNSSTWIGADGLPSKSVRALTRSLETLLTSNFNQVSGTVGITPAAFTAAKSALSGTFGYADDLLALGAYVNPAPADKAIGSLPNKIDRILQLVENDELYDIDISVEAGLGTIYATTCAAATPYYDDTLMNPRLQQAIGFLQTTLNYTAPTDDSTLDLRGNYNTIFSKFADFARDRMDHIFIADPIRHILVQGNNSKTLNDSSKSWSQHVFSPLRHQFELANTSYAAAYANWARVNDGFSQTNVWVPFSGTVASDFARSDRDFAYWAAPAGFRRGLVSEVDDIAIAPNQKQRDDLYKFNLNPITQFVREGIVIYGQKTLNRMPSAFDRVNVRRLFILLEKQTKAIARFYVFEPNTLYTRTRIVDDLTPNFEAAKTATINQGIYDYIIVCDDRNNPPSVIDANELVVDIYIKPVRTAEFILVNFHATRTSANFQEILR